MSEELIAKAIGFAEENAAVVAVTVTITVISLLYYFASPSKPGEC
jgi:hypothetical protein